jgi:hypothetical protein
MEHLMLKAATTAETDQGIFEAVISSAAIDREKDIVSPAGMVAAMQKWVPTGKNITLAWQHSTAPEDQIGYIDPSTVRVVGDDVVASGWIDQSTDRGKHAWRLVKSGTLGFSFGYLTTKARPRRGGGRHLDEFDVFEVTATPVPIQNSTRVLGWKGSMTAEEVAQLERQMDDEVVPEGFEEKAWDGSASRFTDEQYAASCIVDRALCDPSWRDKPVKQRYSIPIRDPGASKANPDALGPAAAALAGGRTPLANMCDAARTAAENKLRAAYRAAGLDVPDSLKSGKALPDPEEQRERAIAEEVDAAWALREAEEEEIGEPPPEPVRPAVRPPDPAVAPPDTQALRERVKALERQLELEGEPEGSTPNTLLRIPHTEMDGLAAGELKAVWSTAFVNGLPDSAFLYIAPGGTKDSDGRTVPRSLRFFPYRDDTGAVDLPHLRNALARIPQSNVPQAVKDRLMARAQKLLEGQKAVGYIVKAVWSTAFINGLPDSAFLYVTPGGSKDSEGKTTPRSLRYFPYRDENGAVDLPHLRNALARIPQSNLDQSIKDRLMSKGQKLLEGQKAVATGRREPVDSGRLREALGRISDAGLAPGDLEAAASAAAALLELEIKTADGTAGQRTRTVDPLRERADAVQLEFASGGESLRKPPRQKASPAREPELPLAELRRRSRDEIIEALSGMEQ